MLTAKITDGMFRYSVKSQGGAIRIAGPIWFVNVFLKHFVIPGIKKAAH